MSLNAGTKLGAYEIVALIGAGGMGEVYRAKDTRLDRTVAIKVLPRQFAADPDARARFEREGRAISSLEHPHICALYDVGEQDGTTFLVMQYLDGETLEARLTKGPLPLAQAAQVAIDIADALDKAHRAAIVHRDLKPGNIMLTSSGAKLLDFGLAKRAVPVVATTGLSMLPTTPPGVTAQGTILGTFQYMAPEQIEGLEADARTDIFSFGVVLFEMIAGRRAFEGKTRASLLGAILKDEPPPVSTVQVIAPKTLDRIITTCVAKDPDDRYQSARDLLRELKWAFSGGAVARETAPVSKRALYWSLAWAVAAAALLALSIVTAQHLRETTPPEDAIQFTIMPPDGSTFATPLAGGTGSATQAAVSPDGRNVVFVGHTQNRFQLWLRPIASLEAHPIPGTEDGTFPFWDPDSRYIGFFAQGKLKKVLITGGPPSPLCDVQAGRGGTWNRDNVIIFAPGSGALRRVSSAGGESQAVSVLDEEYGESGHRFPMFLPDGRHFVYTGFVGTCCPAAKPARIRVGSLDMMDATTLIQVESAAVFASGHLLFNRDGTLMATPFDATSRQFTGDGFPVAEGVAREGSRYASFSASNTGVLLYGSGGAGRATTRLTWIDRTGDKLNTVGDPARYEHLALSPDEQRVAVTLVVVDGSAPPNRDIWIVDVGRGIPNRFTLEAGDDTQPVWSPDNSQILFSAMRDGSHSTLRRKRLDATADEPVFPEAFAGPALPTDWSRDGQHIAYAQNPGTGFFLDLWVLPLFGDRKPFPLVKTAFAELNAAFSPDGQWVAFQSNETGQSQIYVQSFPVPGRRITVSKDGGVQPVWRRDGKEMFFLSPDGRMMAAAIDTAGQPEVGIPIALFATSTNTNPALSGRHYAVTKDGARFLVNVIEEPSRTTPLTVVMNWLAAVEK